MTQMNTTGSGGAHAEVNAAIVNTSGRVRWGAVWAGLLTALATLIVLAALGAALGLSVWDPIGRAEGFGWFAAIWGAISFLLAFLLGGWMASRSAVGLGDYSGVLNGAMVWALGISLVFVFTYMGGTILGTAFTGTAYLDTAAGAQQAGDRITTAGETGLGERTTFAAWWAFLWLILGLGAAALGGYMGAGDHRDRRFTAAT